MKINCSDVYKSYQNLIIHSESTSWSRFGNFLVLTSILILAWVTLFTAENHNFWMKIVMTAISAFGVMTGLAWADLGKRGRSYLDQYKEKAKALEDKRDWWENGIEITDLPFQIQVQTNRCSSSRILLVWSPLFFSLLHLFLLLATWIGTHRVPNH